MPIPYSSTAAGCGLAVARETSFQDSPLAASSHGPKEDQVTSEGTEPNTVDDDELYFETMLRRQEGIFKREHRDLSDRLEADDGRHLANFIVQRSIIKALARHPLLGAAFVKTLHEEGLHGTERAAAAATLKDEPHALAAFEGLLKGYEDLVEREKQSVSDETRR